MARSDERSHPGWPRRLGLGVLVALATAACGPAPPPEGTAAGASGWHEFDGSWNASGSRRTLSLGEFGTSALLDLRGSMFLAGAGRPGAGFRGEAIALVDRKAGLVGRSVWTDERGDQVFSEFTGEGTAAKNRITGTFLGGTGRFAGITGTYEFSWQYVVEAEDGSIQGRATGLKGRFRIDPAAKAATK